MHPPVKQTSDPGVLEMLETAQLRERPTLLTTQGQRDGNQPIGPTSSPTPKITK